MYTLTYIALWCQAEVIHSGVLHVLAKLSTGTFDAA